MIAFNPVPLPELHQYSSAPTLHRRPCCVELTLTTQRSNTWFTQLTNMFDNFVIIQCFSGTGCFPNWVTHRFAKPVNQTENFHLENLVPQYSLSKILNTFLNVIWRRYFNSRHSLLIRMSTLKLRKYNTIFLIQNIKIVNTLTIT